MHITFVSSYIPRKCGIATYTRDLYEALVKQGTTISIIALENPLFTHSYKKPVIDTIKQEQSDDYVKTVEKINKSKTDFVHIQHEFGLFGGDDGEYILLLTNKLKKPFFVTFHTLLSSPTDHQKYIIQELARQSVGITVMEEIAKDRLVHIYGINPDDISIILHGVPDIDDISKKYAKTKLDLKDKFVILSSNLISKNKGLEYAISALPKVIKKIPNVKLLIVGETHPVVKQQEGEIYRSKLEALVKDLNLSSYVHFKNEYVTLNQLRLYLAASDICITPYLDPQQITSGTLAYAIGAGKVCISTPYIYAQHILANNRGVLVPFHDENSIASVITDLYSNSTKRREIEKKARVYGLKMRWPFVAKKHNEIYKNVLKKNVNLTKNLNRHIKKMPDTQYLDFLTDSVGMLQHTYFSLPEVRFGYSTDDNARALIIAGSMYKKTKNKHYLHLMKTYLGFLRLAQEKNGKFHTLLNFQRQWTDTEDLADPYGRSMWAIGYTLFIIPSNPFSRTLDEMFRHSMQQIEQIRDLRSIANTIIGLYYYIQAFETQKDSVSQAINYLKILSEVLVRNYNTHEEKGWEWFEDSMTYDNFRLPHALFCAFFITGEKLYENIAEKTLNCTLKYNYNFNKSYFDFIGQNGWLEKKGIKAKYDQQSLEAAGAVEAFAFAYFVTGKLSYFKKAHEAFSWFFGKNRNNAPLVTDEKDGVYDGLTKTGVNENKGAESIICFLIAWLCLQDVSKKV